MIVDLSPQDASDLPRLLAQATSMPVAHVRGLVDLEPDHVYVVYPALQLSMHDGQINVTQPERPPAGQIAIDVFFRTLAEAHRERAVGIVLSGGGLDGSVGLGRIKECGGFTIAQDPQDAEHDAMPSSAIATGSVDLVLPVGEMAAKVTALWANMQRIALPDPPELELPVTALSGRAWAESEAALADIVQLLRVRTGHDFRRYKRATVMRRLERRLQVNGIDSLPNYRAHLEAHPSETSSLLQDLLISVTSFFRDAEAFDALAGQLDAAVFNAAADAAPQKIRAWVAGCATGEEAYSVAMQLTEQSMARHLEPANEELVTANRELESEIEAAGKVNEDLNNLIASTDIATIFVDRDMVIKRFTPRASQLFNLLQTDVGRSLLDIGHRLRYDSLERDVPTLSTDCA